MRNFPGCSVLFVTLKILIYLLTTPLFSKGKMYLGDSASNTHTHTKDVNFRKKIRFPYYILLVMNSGFTLSLNCCGKFLRLVFYFWVFSSEISVVRPTDDKCTNKIKTSFLPWK